jgi:hypothetical protein
MTKYIIRHDGDKALEKRARGMAITLALVAGLSGCASLISNSAYPVYIDSNVEGTNYRVLNWNGLEVKRGLTPGIAVLESGAGYFRKANYKVEFEAPGHVAMQYPLRSRLNGWYWGNFITLPGFLIDPATGAMWCLPGRLNAQLPEHPVYSLPAE